MGNKKKLALATMVITSALALSACGGVDRMLKAVDENTEAKKQITPEEQAERDYKEQVAQWNEMYSKNDKTVEEYVGEIKKEKVGDSIKAQVVLKDSYTKPIELAKYTSDILFKFTSGKITGEEYVTFIETYGSPVAKEMYLTHDGHDEDVNLMNTVQSNILNVDIKYTGYEFSTPNVVRDEVTFYRKLIAANGKEQYYKTTLIKIDGKLYFQSDDLSIPVEF
ncbi:hypothetical protein [Viridibacillus arvi]|uniref:hypothetical protein n=1 Tax=Viridibacillus arvi TaxID=263475 RepID=UPI0034CF87FD